MTRSVFELAFDDHEGWVSADESYRGFALWGHGQHDEVSNHELANCYASATLAVLRKNLRNADASAAEYYPALFLARHSIELYLKSMFPEFGWRLKENKNRSSHQIDNLINALRDELDPKLSHEEISKVCDFLSRFHQLDPMAMAFRFGDGALSSFSENKKGKRKFDLPPGDTVVNAKALLRALDILFGFLDRTRARLEVKRSLEFARSLENLPPIDLSDMGPPND